MYIMVFELVTSDTDGMSPLNFPLSFRLNTVANIKCLEVNAALDKEYTCEKPSGKTNMSHATQPG